MKAKMKTFQNDQNVRKKNLKSKCKKEKLQPKFHFENPWKNPLSFFPHKRVLNKTPQRLMSQLIHYLERKLFFFLIREEEKKCNLDRKP